MISFLSQKVRESQGNWKSKSVWTLIKVHAWALDTCMTHAWFLEMWHLIENFKFDYDHDSDCLFGIGYTLVAAMLVLAYLLFLKQSLFHQFLSIHETEPTFWLLINAISKGLHYNIQKKFHGYGLEPLGSLLSAFRSPSWALLCRLEDSTLCCQIIAPLKQTFQHPYIFIKNQTHPSNGTKLLTRWKIAEKQLVFQ